jgi:hypothetical protein
VRNAIVHRSISASSPKAISSCISNTASEDFGVAKDW